MLTKDQIHDISAGRTLDKLVAEIIFGWESIGQWDHIDDKGDMVADDSDWVGVPPWGKAKTIPFNDGELRTIEFLPYYSSRIEDSEKIIDHLLDLDYDFALRYRGQWNNQWSATFYDTKGELEWLQSGGFYIKGKRREFSFESISKNKCLAIVRSGLMTVISKQIKEGK